MEHSPHEDGLHLAQFNLAVLRHPLDHPASKGFVDLIDDTNVHAEASAGFVWRNGIDTRDDDLPYDDPLITVNASVWETPQHLRDFAYRGFHRDVYRRRAEWFVESAAVMWWIPAGDVPSMDECLARMDFFGHHGTTPYAFTTRDHLPALVMRSVGHAAADAWLDGERVGAVRAVVAGLSTWQVEEWFVVPAHRGMRIGAALMSELTVAALAAGVERIRSDGPCDEGADQQCEVTVEPIRTWHRPQDHRRPG